MIKIEPASQDEHAFASRVNLALDGKAAVSPFCSFNEETQARTYGLVFSYGSKRYTITADSPFHDDPVEDVVKRVTRWLAGGAGQLYSPDPKYAGDFDG